MTEFLHVITADELIQRLGNFPRLPAENIPLDDSIGRTLCEDILAGEDLPEGPRSTVDGYAVCAEDTLGASDTIPAFLELAPSVPMGIIPDFEIHRGQAAQIPTGGFLPRGADAVVMIEYTNAAGGGHIEVTKPVTPKTNVLQKGEDARAGEILLQRGKKLRPQELGLLAALGITSVPVYRKPRVTVISSGDEIIPIERKPAPGQVRDANSHAICALIRSCGADATCLGIVPDHAGKLKDAISDGLSRADVVVISGGSSVGARDLMVDAVSGLAGVEVLAHGIAIRPGKPTLLAHCAGKPIFGLPGHPVSALIVAQVFLAPFLLYLQGSDMEKGPPGRKMKAKLTTSIHSTIGLEEYVRVQIEEGERGDASASPVFGKSGMISTMVKANGIVRIPLTVEGFSRGEIVPVIEYQ